MFYATLPRLLSWKESDGFYTYYEEKNILGFKALIRLVYGKIIILVP